MIKKLLYGVVIAAGLVSCNDDYTDWSAPQHNDPETPMELPNISVQTATASINVGELEDAGTVNVSLVNFQGDIPENVQVTDRYVELVPTYRNGSGYRNSFHRRIRSGYCGRPQ